MGYTTDFEGILKFKNDLSNLDLAYLNTFLGNDRRDLGYNDDSIYENGKYGSYWYHIDLELAEDFSGIQWNGTEKCYDMEHIINFITDKMREKNPEFELTGELLAQGEDIEDRWRLVMVDGRATKVDFPKAGHKITCPNCEEQFFLEQT